MSNKFDAGQLVNPRQVGTGYYFLVEGENEAGQTFSFITRGAGKQNAATRIPIRICPKKSGDLQRILQVAQEQTPHGKPEFENYISACKSLQSEGIDVDFELLFVVMPRYGNLISGLEADAPGGTAHLGETRLEVAAREFEEEADLTTLCVYDCFPSWLQFSSGCYDEVQHIDFALVTGSPTKLVEGATSWGSVPLKEFAQWTRRQNQTDDPSLWETTQFIPLDGKVVLATMWLIHEIAQL